MPFSQKAAVFPDLPPLCYTAVPLCTRTGRLISQDHSNPIEGEAGESRINLVSVLFLACCCFTPGETQRDLRFHRNVFLLPVITHLILRVADHSLYTDVCADANQHKKKKRKHQTLSVFTACPIFYAVLF